MTREHDDWMNVALPERRAPRRAALVLLPILAVAVLAGGYLYGPTLLASLEEERPQPKPITVDVKKLPRTPSVVAGPTGSGVVAVDPRKIVGQEVRPPNTTKAPLTKAPVAGKAAPAKTAPTPKASPPVTRQAPPAESRPTTQAPTTSRTTSTARPAGMTRELRFVRSGERMFGEDVRRVQIRLMQLTGDDIARGGDGWFGPRTERGVRQFQERAGLPVTGVVDAATWNALFGTNASR